MKIKIDRKARPDLSLLAIEAAEEIERTRQNIQTNLKSTKELSGIIKESTWRLDYQTICSNAYFSTYAPKDFEFPKDLILTERLLKLYMKTMIGKLDAAPNLKDTELGKLASFCVNFSDHYTLYKEEFKEGPCFLVA